MTCNSIHCESLWIPRDCVHALVLTTKRLVFTGVEEELGASGNGGQVELVSGLTHQGTGALRTREAHPLQSTETQGDNDVLR